MVTALTSDAHFLPELFLRLEKHTPDDLEWRDLVAFLQVREGGAGEGGGRGNSALVSYLVAFLQVTRERSGEECEGRGPFCR